MKWYTLFRQHILDRGIDIVFEKSQECTCYMTNIELVCHFFKEGYERKNYEAVMNDLADDHVDHSPAGARGKEFPLKHWKTLGL